LKKKTRRAKPKKPSGKKAHEMTTDELAERLFPKGVRERVKREVAEKP